MKITSEEFSTIVKFARDHKLIDEKGFVVRKPLDTLITMHDQFVEFFKVYLEKCESNPLKPKHPAYHKVHGPVLVVNTFLGVTKDNELDHIEVKCITIEGQTVTIPYNEMLPYNTSTEVLFGK